MLAKREQWSFSCGTLRLEKEAGRQACLIFKIDMGVDVTINFERYIAHRAQETSKRMLHRVCDIINNIDSPPRNTECRGPIVNDE